jgi:Mn-dependent DtxR family transcriptional regulator
MQLGVFNYIPETRLVPTALNDIKKIYDQTTNKDKIELNEIASILGYKQPKGGAFYRRIQSLIAYGLIEGRGVFKITELGKDMAHSFDDYYQRKELYRKSVLNVPLWNELYKMFQKNLPENIEESLQKITGAEPLEVKRVEKDIRRWYEEDIKLIPDEKLQPVGKTVELSYNTIEVLKKSSDNLIKQAYEIRKMAEQLEATIKSTL